MDINSIQIIGNEIEVFDYNLNKQFSNIKKVIITSREILDSLNNSNLKHILEEYKFGGNFKDFEEKISVQNQDSFLLETFDENLNKIILEKVNLVFNNMGDIKLDNYNFMNSVSNVKFNLTLRSREFSLTKYFEEKGQIIFNIKDLISTYLKNNFNSIRHQEIDRFQIEITQSEDVYKHIFLKKDNNSILLSSEIGFSNNLPINFSVGSEFYFSIGEDFKFYKNMQTQAILREHTKLQIKNINSPEKILTNDELILINQTTKNMHDVLVEMYLTEKGKLRITNLSLLENNIYYNSKNGFLIHSSSKNYDKIALITIRDNFEEESLNPKYLIIRNKEEINQILNEVNKIKLLDGIIFTCNFYNPILDFIGKKLDIDIIYHNQNLQKTLETKFNKETLEIELGSNEKSLQNPFSKILEGNEKKDEFLEKLKNMDLKSPKYNNKFSQKREEISNVTKSIIASKDSSLNKDISGNISNNILKKNGEKKSAMQILAESVLNKNNNDENPKNSIPNPTPCEVSNQKEVLLNQNSKTDSNDIEEVRKVIMENPFESPQNTNKIVEPVFEKQNTFNLNSEKKQSFGENKRYLDFEKYFKSCATKLISLPNIENSNCFITTPNTISQVRNGEIFFIPNSFESLSNPHINYIIPIKNRLSVKNSFNNSGNELENIYFSIKTLEEFFLISSDSNEKYIVNLEEISNEIKALFLKTVFSQIDSCGLVLEKSDLNLVSKYIPKISMIFISDVQSSHEFEICKNQILSFEKQFILERLKEKF